jgi:hypothetical protein
MQKVEMHRTIKFKGRIEIGRPTHVALRLHSTEKLWRTHEDNARNTHLE